MIAGVSGGLGDYFDVDPVLIRLAWVVLTVLTGGVFGLAYLLLWVIVPIEGRAPPTRETLRDSLSEMSAEARALADEVREAFQAPRTGEGEAGSTPPPSGAVDPPQSVRRDPDPWPADGERRTRDRAIWGGAILILIGLLFLVDNLGIFPRFSWGVLWPLILVAIGIALLVQRNRG
jgi:phage shock protein C